MNLEVKRINPESAIPKHANPGDAGIDLSVSEDVDIQRTEVPLFVKGE